MVIAFVILCVILMSLLPVNVKAEQIPRRRVEMATSAVSTATTYDLIFQIPDVGADVVVQGIEIEFTDSPLGSYGTVPSSTPTVGVSPGSTLLDNTSTGTLCGTTGTACNGDTFRAWTETGAFTATRTDGTSFTGTAGTALNQIHLVRTTATAETDDTGTNVHSIRISGLTNDNTVNTTFFARIRLYSDNTESGGVFTGAVIHEGVVAGSTTQVLTINARVQEALSFCVGAATTTVVTAWTTATQCSNVTNTTVDMGPLGSSGITTSDTNEGNDRDGVVMLRSNAVNGTTIVYRSILDAGASGSNRGSLKIAGQTCGETDLDATESNTDRCFNSDEGGQAFGTNIEGFGMRLINVDTASETPTANLTASAPYNSGTDYAWDDDADPVIIATSTGASEKVVDDEAFQLRFGARSALTTPTGLYSVQAEFIATSVY